MKNYKIGKSDEELFKTYVIEGIKSNIKKKWASTDVMMDDLREFILDAKDAGGEDLVREIYDALRLMTNYAEGELKESDVYEASIELDALDPKAKALKKLLKSNKVKMEIIDDNGPNGISVVKLEGKREDLETIISHPYAGWDDPELEEFIEESVGYIAEGNAFLGARAKAIEEDLEEFEFNGKIYPVIKSKKTVNENKIDIALNKMDKWLPEDEDAMERYYEILNQEGWKEMQEFFELHGNEDVLQSYGLTQRDMKKLAQAAMESTVHSGDKLNERVSDKVHIEVIRKALEGWENWDDSRLDPIEIFIEDIPLEYDVTEDQIDTILDKAMGMRYENLIDFAANAIYKDIKTAAKGLSKYYKPVKESKLTEARRIQTKRKYTENHPERTVGTSARIRNKILETIKDGRMTQSEFDKLVKELSSDNKRWMKRNNKMFNISEDGISLSKFGQKILKGITVNESFSLFIKNK